LTDGERKKTPSIIIIIMDAARRALGGRTPPAVPGAKNGVPDVSAFLGAVRADGSPDFASMARASGMDPNAFQAHAESLWSKMDALAGDPAAYRAFLEEKARDAGVDAFGGGGGGGGDIRLREAEEANETDAGPGNRQAPGLARADAPRATFLAPAPTSRRRNEVDDGDGVRGDEFGVGVVAVWRARESLEELTPVPSAFDTNVGADADGRRKHTREGNTNDARTPLEVPVRMKRGAAARVEKVALPDPRVAPGDIADVAAEGHSPLAALASASGAPPPLDATVYDVEAHPDAVARALEDPAYQAALIEAATRLAETQAGAPLFVRDPPGGRRCYARRGEAPPRAAAAAAAADARRRGGGGEGMSASLLTEIAGMGLGDKQKSSSTSAGRSAGEEKTTTNAPRLVEEIASSRSVRVERDAAGAPVLVSVTMRLPQLVSMKDANLEVGARFITLDPGPGEPRAAVALPVAVDPDAARAKWTKKTRTLVVTAPPRE